MKANDASYLISFPGKALKMDPGEITKLPLKRGSSALQALNAHFVLGTLKKKVLLILSLIPTDFLLSTVPPCRFSSPHCLSIALGGAHDMHNAQPTLLDCK